MTSSSLMPYFLFQSTLLMRGATQKRRRLRLPAFISIHAPHARSDDGRSHGIFRTAPFQSTLLMRGATRRLLVAVPRQKISIHAPHARSDQPPVVLSDTSIISIHAPHARSDLISAPSALFFTHFNPRSSCEERHDKTVDLILFPYFNPRSSCEERQRLPARARLSRNFNPRSSCEERRDA